jgi:sulfoxide reductase heme-binding subunit YedZ
MAVDLRKRVLLLKGAVWLLCLVPLGVLAWRHVLGEGLGANPIEELEHWAGLSALVVLLGALSVTPVRRLTGWNVLQKVRRLVGLFAFFYVVVHLSIYVGLDQFFGWSYIVEDVAERPYIMVGFGAFVLLLPLAVTSTRGWIRRLGKNWRRLHRLVYPAAILGVLHYLWVTKADDRGPFIAAAVLVLLFVLRLPVSFGTARKKGEPGETLPTSAP